MLKKKRTWIILGIFGLIAAWWFAFHAGGGDPLFTIGKETTFVEGPVDKHGYIDYATALNQILSKGVTPKNNAQVLLVKAIGPRPEGGEMPSEFYRWLGIDEPPKVGEYLLTQENFLKTELKVTDYNQISAMTQEWSENAEIPWTANDSKELVQWLKKNEKPLAVIAEAVKRTHLFNPLVARAEKGERSLLIGVLIPIPQICRQVAQALSTRAMLSIGEKRFGEAWQDLLTCHRLGRLVGKGATLIESLVGIAIEKMAISGSQVYLTHANLSREQVQSHLKDLESLQPMASGADKVHLAERFMALDAVMHMDQSGPEVMKMGLFSSSDSLTGNVDWDPALRQINHWYDQMVAAYRTKDRHAFASKTAKIYKEIDDRRKDAVDRGLVTRMFTTRAGRGEGIGSILAALMLPAVDKIRDAEDRARQEHQNLLLAFRLEMYRTDNDGQYPEKLTQLVPKYVKAIPPDIFDTSSPPIYRKTKNGYTLYSVGVNGVDNRGENDFGQSADDLTIEIERP